jgi:hypothetical protein
MSISPKPQRSVSENSANADSVVSTPGSGLVFDNTWGTGVTTEYESCVVAAEKQLEGIFTNKITLNMTFNLGATDGDHELSRTANFHCAYTTLKAAILKFAPNVVLPANDPSGGKGFDIPEAYARMLKLTSSTPSNDATITLDSALNWSFGQDAVNAITHAITESAMGRDSGLGDFNGGIWTAADLFRYTASGSYDSSDGRDGKTTYFSSDGGKDTSEGAGLSFTNLFNGTKRLTGGNDPDDWTQHAVFGTTDTNVTLTLAPTEVAIMNALGWKGSLQPQLFDAPNGDWETFSNWNNGYNPISIEDVEIGYFGAVGANATLSGSTDNVTVNSLTLNAHSSLTIDNGATLTATDGTVVNPADTIHLVGGNEGVISVGDNSTLAIGDSFDNSGTLAIGPDSGGLLELVGDVTLYGKGAINLGGISIGFGADIARGPGPNPNPGPPIAFIGTGDITGDGAMVNVNETISGAGSIAVASLDNQANASIGSTIVGAALQIASNSISNEGELFAAAQTTLYLDPHGPSASLINNGEIDLAAGADFEVTGNLTAFGDGSINLTGAGAALTSDGERRTVFTNENSILATASAQIGDAGIKSVNDLSLTDSGSIIATGSGVTLTLNTGANVIVDNGGLFEAEAGAQLTIDSPVKYGTTLPIPEVAPQSGGTNPPIAQSTIEAASGGVVNIDAQIFDGTAGASQTNGRILVNGGTVEAAAGVAIAAPVTFGKAGGALDLSDTPDTVAVSGAKGVINLSSAAADVSGGAFTVNETGADTLTIGGNGALGAADIVHGSHETITTLASSHIAFVGSNDTIDAGGGVLSLQGTNDHINMQNAFGTLAIDGFDATDKISFSKSDFANFQFLHDHMAQSGANTVVTLDANDAVTLKNVDLSTLTASQFHFS